MKKQKTKIKIEKKKDASIVQNIVTLDKKEHKYNAECYRYKFCAFCEKRVKINFISKMAENYNNKKFFCPFCIRNNFHYKSNRNVLIFSFRAIIGHYYYNLKQLVYDDVFEKIPTFISRHIKVGMNNPALSYDPDTCLWFMDFNKIQNKTNFETTLSTVQLMLNWFGLEKVIFKDSEIKMWKKYKSAIVEFQSTRTRQEDKKMLIPTLYGIHNCFSGMSSEQTRYFIPILE